MFPSLIDPGQRMSHVDLISRGWGSQPNPFVAFSYPTNQVSRVPILPPMKDTRVQGVPGACNVR